MHLRQTAKFVLLLIVLLGSYSLAQLNDPSEVIKTTEDIQIYDDINTSSSAPRYDEEFSREKISEDKKIEEEIENAQSQEGEVLEEEYVERQVLPGDSRSTEDLEQTLKENAKLQQEDQFIPQEEELEGFAIDPPQESAPVTDKPEDISPVEENLEHEFEKTERIVQPQTLPEELDTPVTEESLADEKIEFEDRKREEYVTVPTFVKPLTEKEIKDLEKRTNVTIERDPYIETTERLDSYLKSFKDRRPSWTYQVGIEYTTFEPLYYLSTIAEDGNVYSFGEFYEYGDVPLSQVTFDFKKNFSFGAIGLGASAGYYRTGNDYADLTLLVGSLRASLYLDTLFEEPYIVPYVTGGYSYIDYKETYEDDIIASELSGSTDNFYFGFGFMFQLDWIDRASDISSYEMGLENTFAFIEGRMYTPSGIARAEEDPDFSSDLFFVAGLRLEF